MNRYSFVASFLVMNTVMWAAPAFAQGQAVHVTTVAELYAAVNNPANTGVQVELASGTYVLDPTQPNGGRLFLQDGMDLVGQNSYVDLDGDGVWDPRNPSTPEVFADPATETIIDGSTIVPPSIIGGVDAIILVGHDNQVERLTVRNYAGLGLIAATLAPTKGGLQAAVVDCIIEKSHRGVSLGNLGATVSGLNSRFTLERNIVRQHSVGGAFILNFALAMDARVDALVRHNRFYNNPAGLVVVSGAAADNGAAEVVSQGNIAEQNQVGLFLAGGQDALRLGLPQGGNNGQLRFTSDGDAIWNNVGSGGVFAAGGYRSTSAAGTSSNNDVQLQFLGTRFVKGEGPGNQFVTGTPPSSTRRDLWIAGGEGVMPPGSGNTVEILVRQATSDGADGAFFVNAAVYCTPGAPNTVTVIGSSLAFTQANDGVASPPSACFSSLQP